MSKVTVINTDKFGFIRPNGQFFLDGVHLVNTSEEPINLWELRFSALEATEAGAKLVEEGTKPVLNTVAYTERMYITLYNYDMEELVEALSAKVAQAIVSAMVAQLVSFNNKGISSEQVAIIPVILEELLVSTHELALPSVLNAVLFPAFSAIEHSATVGFEVSKHKELTGLALHDVLTTIAKQQDIDVISAEEIKELSTGGVERIVVREDDEGIQTLHIFGEEFVDVKDLVEFVIARTQHPNADILYLTNSLVTDDDMLVENASLTEGIEIPLVFWLKRDTKEERRQKLVDHITSLLADTEHSFDAAYSAFVNNDEKILADLKHIPQLDELFEAVSQTYQELPTADSDRLANEQVQMKLESLVEVERLLNESDTGITWEALEQACRTQDMEVLDKVQAIPGMSEALDKFMGDIIHASEDTGN